MKGLSLWQPWAQAFAEGVKCIETRGWPTAHRGDVLVCSTAGRVKSGLDFDVLATLPHSRRPLGCALGVVSIVDCLPIVPPVEDQALPAGVDCIAIDEDGLVRVWRWNVIRQAGAPDIGLHVGGETTEHEAAWGDYTPGRFGWVTGGEPRVLARPYPVKGAQRLWNVPDAVEAVVLAELAA
jgi:activating signal cointegrator 1